MSDSPDLSIYEEPWTRLYRLWSPELLRAAEIQADAGNLLLAADLCETMFGDDRVKAVLDTRTDTLLGLPLSFEASGDGRRKTTIKNALEVEEDWWASFPECEQKLLHTWGVILGVGLAELCWEWDEDTDRVLPKMRTKSPRNLRFDILTRQWKLRVLNASTSSYEVYDEIVVTPNDGKWLLYTPYGYSRPWVHGAYRALSRWSLLKQYALQDWGFYSERHGLGFMLGTGDISDDKQRKQIKADLQKLGRNSALVLPKDFDVKLIEAQAKTWETFAAQISTADNGYAITILGQNMTTQAGQTGNQGAASMHGKVALGRTKADNESLSTLYHDGALTHWAQFNFGDRKLAPWPVRDTTPTSDKKEDAAVEQMIAQALATKVKAGIITPNEARKRLGEAPMDGGDELKPDATPVPPADNGQTQKEAA